MRIIKNTKISTSKGHDGISSELLKLITRSNETYIFLNMQVQ